MKVKKKVCRGEGLSKNFCFLIEETDHCQYSPIPIAHALTMDVITGDTTAILEPDTISTKTKSQHADVAKQQEGKSLYSRWHLRGAEPAVTSMHL